MVFQLAGIRLPEGAQPQPPRAQLASELVEIGLLQSSGADVDQVTSLAPDRTLRGLLRKPQFPLPGMVATELQELASGDKDTLPHFRVGASLDESGWYELQSADVNPAHSDVDDVFQYTLNLKRAGTRGSSVRAVETNPRSVTHPFGSGSDEIVAIPAAARKVRWFDMKTQETASASPSTSDVATAYDTLDEYDVTTGRSALNGNRVALIYDVDYSDDVFGVRVYDTRGNDSQTDLDGARQWQVIHESQHDVSDPIAITNHRLRITVTEPDSSTTGELTAETWDSNNDEWSSLTLDSTNYAPLDLDITHIGQQRVDFQMVWEDSGTLQAVNFVLTQNSNTALVYPPDGESIPTGLQDHLDSFATTTETDVRPSRTLIPRSDVRAAQ